ncbi:hypothetical protein CRUP_034547 [Coryphaenoides rupestris]|nr:hypothetical protein CRUP_034547 [Coryphaenoides rupestris]
MIAPGVYASALCRDVAWLTEELLFRNKDVGFGGSVPEVVCSALALLRPQLTIASTTSRKDPFIIPSPSLAAITSLFICTQIVTHSFIAEAVGACAVSAMLCEVAGGAVSSSRVHGQEVKGDMEFDVVLCEAQLTQHSLQLCHLLPPGFLPPCQSSYNFALDAVDSLVRCGLLVMEEITRDAPMCDFWKRHGSLSWPTTDDLDHSDSECEDQEVKSYKWLSVLLRYTRIYAAEQTRTNIMVLVEEWQDGGKSLVVSPLFQLADNTRKLQHFFSQYLCS